VSPERAAELIATEGLSTAAVESALGGEFSLRFEAPATFERLFLDTFDGLLYGAGRTLRSERGRLQLVERSSARVSGDVEFAQPSGPVMAAELPPGELREVVARVIDVRALIPTARVRLEVVAGAVLNEMDKTVVRIVLERGEFVSPTGRASPLRARLRLAPVRGYDTELARVRSLLVEQFTLTEADATLHEEAVRAAGGTPEGIGSKVEVSLIRGQRADAAAVAVLRRLVAVMDANLPGMLADTDTEFLHDYRVSVRRTRAVLKELKRVFPPAELATMRAEFRWLQQATGDARDLDVYVLGFDSLAAQVPQEMRGDLEPLLSVLRNRRLVAHGLLVRALRSQRTAALRSDWLALLDGLVARAWDDRPDAIRPIGEVAGGRIRKVYRQMLRMGAAIEAGGVGTPPEDYHELRKQGKELRYLLELFGVPLYSSEVVRPMFRTLKALQDVLGRHQDLEVQSAMLRSLRDEVSSFPGGPGALMAMGVLVQRLEAEAQAARDEFASVFAPFAGKPQRALVDETFAP
jgi:CHAD domain-containing protein